ncbi:hypothetical protein FOA52_005022 [Chlamydomonas sp. UWO 241]|nr:hypothetical protein FOA52_005022 [Chlamydomonas sp. UWO 241]
MRSTVLAGQHATPAVMAVRAQARAPLPPRALAHTPATTATAARAIASPAAGAHPSRRNLVWPHLRRASTITRLGGGIGMPQGGSGRPVVLVTEDLGDAGMALLAEFADVEAHYGLSESELIKTAACADAMIVMSATNVPRAVFEASNGRLKVLGRAGVGTDNIDLAAATEYGCLVVNAPTANTVAAAEHTIALLCAMSRNIAQADAAMKRGVWDPSAFVGTAMSGKTLAVFGFGKVGTEVARRARGLGMTVLAYDPYAAGEKAAAMGVKLVTFDAAISRADFLSLHTPLSPATRHLFNADAFKRMQRGVRIVNVARGGVIDEDALLAALESGQVAHAALDVFNLEPPFDDSTSNALVQHPRVICTPHLGASTMEALEGVAIEVVEAVVQALQGRLSPNAVNAPMVPAEVLQELQPYISLAEGLGRAAVALVSDAGFQDINITYSSPRGDDLDTRLLRAMVLKGMLEQCTTARVNLVNADLLARSRGMRLSEVTVMSDGPDVLTTLSISLGTNESVFSGAVDRAGRIYVEGQVRNGSPFLTKIGNFDVELSVLGSVLLTRQQDQPGIVAGVATVLAEDNVNISFMTVGRTSKGGEAIMAIGIDQEPSQNALARVRAIRGVDEAFVFREI